MKKETVYYVTNNWSNEKKTVIGRLTESEHRGTTGPRHLRHRTVQGTPSCITPSLPGTTDRAGRSMRAAGDGGLRARAVCAARGRAAQHQPRPPRLGKGGADGESCRVASGGAAAAVEEVAARTRRVVSRTGAGAGTGTLCALSISPSRGRLAALPGTLTGRESMSSRRGRRSACRRAPHRRGRGWRCGSSRAAAVRAAPPSAAALTAPRQSCHTATLVRTAGVASHPCGRRGAPAVDAALAGPAPRGRAPTGTTVSLLAPSHRPMPSREVARRGEGKARRVEQVALLYLTCRRSERRASSARR